MVIRGETNLIKVYDLSLLLDLENYDLNEASDIQRLQETIGSYIDAGEVEAVNLPVDLMGVVPDGAEIEIGEQRYTFEDIEYINRSVDDLISANFEKGSVILLVQAKGEGYFEYEENPSVEELKIGYTACDMEAPDEPVYDFFCDLMLPGLVEINGEKAEISASNFYPKDTIVAEVYRVNEDGSKYLEKVAEVDILHEQWDLFEDIIQVDYDDPIA